MFRPSAEAVALSGTRPYDLRHAFASLLIAEGRMSIVEIAAQLGHNPTVCLDIYGHEMTERWSAGVRSAEGFIECNVLAVRPRRCGCPSMEVLYQLS